VNSKPVDGIIIQETQLSLTNRETICANAMPWLTSEKHGPPHMCYHAEFGRSALQDVSINIGEPQKLGSVATPPP